MKFLLDAHLPYSLKFIFEYKGYEAIHTFDLPNQNSTNDNQIREVSLSENYIVITKDSDFYYSHILNKIPEKLILIKVGNLSKNELKNIFRNNFETIIQKIKENNLMEIYKDKIVVL